MEQNQREIDWQNKINALLEREKIRYVAESDTPLDENVRNDVMWSCSNSLWRDFVTLNQNPNTPAVKVSVHRLSEALFEKNYSNLISGDGLLATQINDTLFFAYMSDVQNNGSQLIIEPQWVYNGRWMHSITDILPLPASELVNLMEKYSKFRLDDRWPDFAVEVEQCRKANYIQKTYYDSILMGMNLDGIEYSLKTYPDIIYLQFGESTNKKVFYKASVSMDNFQEIISLLREFMTDKKLRRKYGVKKERCGEYRFLR